MDASNPYSHQNGLPRPVFPPQFQPSTPWSTGLCHSSQISLWCVTCWCPCITFGRIAEIVDQGSRSCVTHAMLYAVVHHLSGCVCLYSGSYRTRIRLKYGLEESPCNDYCLHWCCHTCALRQEYRELTHRGFDLSIGWQGNMDRNKGGVGMAISAPAVEACMQRN